MKLEFYHIWQLGGYGMVQNDATGCGNHFHTRPGHFRKFTFGLIFQPLLNLCWTFVGWTNSWPPRPRFDARSLESWPSRPRFRDPSIKSWPWRPRIALSNKGPTKVQQRFKNESKSQAVLGSEHVQGQSPSSDRATAWTQPRLAPSTNPGHESDRGAVPSLLLSAGS